MRLGSFVGLVALSGGCGRADVEAPQREVVDTGRMAPETATMAKKLALLHQATTEHPFQYYYLNSERAGEALRQLEEDVSRQRDVLGATYAVELLYAGQTEEAIAQYEALLEEVDPSRSILTAESRKLTDLLGIAYLRLGEQQNCIVNHAAESCIIPLQGAGIHTLQEGSRKAIGVYETLLGRYQNDYRSRWLLNVAYMTLGRYPQGVPPVYLVPGLVAPDSASFPRFPNRAVDLGLDRRGLAGSVAMEDFDGDGFLDLFVTAHRLNDSVRLYLNDRNGGFVDRTAEAGLEGLAGGLNVSHADYDNDGDADILVLRGAWLGAQGAHPNSLLRNDGHGAFEDVTVEAGLLSYHPTQTAAWADFNLDGWLDLYIGNELSNRWLSAWQQTTSIDDDRSHASELFMNNGDGTFTDVAPSMNLDVELFIKGVAWGDVDNDGLPDLYLSVMGGPNRLYMNRGGSGLDDWTFEEVAGKAGVHEPFFSFPVWFWDYDNDGWLDLCVGNSDLRRLDDAAADLAREYLGLAVQTEMPRIYRNEGAASRKGSVPSFRDVTQQAGMNRVLYAMGGNFGDLDNDGFEDAYFGTGAPDYRSLVPNRMFLNRDGESFEEVTLSGGFGHLQKGHGIAFGDLDRDGDQDLYAVMGGAYEGDVFQDALFENPGMDSSPAWMVLQVEGRAANRSAIGARVELTVVRTGGGRRAIRRVVSTGGSFGSSSLQLEVGLGDAVRIDALEIAWPDSAGTREVHRDLEVNNHYRVVQGAPIERLERPPVPLRAGGAGAHVHGM